LSKNNVTAVLYDIANVDACNNLNKQIISNDDNNSINKIGDWKKGSTKAAMKKKNSNVVSDCTFKYQEQVENAKKAGKFAPHGTLKNIIKEEEGKMVLKLIL
jgi:hypothetical protein